MENDKVKKRTSIKLSKILRHSAIERGLKIDNAGWVNVNDILRKCKEFKNITIDDISYIVENNNKKRFSLIEKDNELFIRANQGHSIASIQDTLLLNEILDPNQIEFAVHSTFRKLIPTIKKNGLCRMTRNHIHMAKSKNVKHGIRANANAYIFINVKQAIIDGIKFYESSNGVILSPGLGIKGIIPPKYFLSIEFN